MNKLCNEILLPVGIFICFEKICKKDGYESSDRRSLSPCYCDINESGIQKLSLRLTKGLLSFLSLF